MQTLKLHESFKVTNQVSAVNYHDTPRIMTSNLYNNHYKRRMYGRSVFLDYFILSSVIRGKSFKLERSNKPSLVKVNRYTVM